MLAATTSPSYSPTCVSGQTPVTSPIAQRRSPARRRASTSMPRGSTSIPTVSSPMPSPPGRRALQPDALDARAAARRDEDAVAAQLGAVLEREDVVVAVAARRARVDAEVQLDPVAAQCLSERLAARLRLGGQHPRGALDQRHLAAEAADDLGQLHPDGAAAEHEQPPRD